MSKYRKINDQWSLYKYGESYKAVYIKSAARRKNQHIPLYPELEGLTPSERSIAWASLCNQTTGGIIKLNEPKKESKSARPVEERLAASLSRTKARILELALCNEFTFFCTFTQDSEKVGSRFDLAAFRKDLAQFIRNQNRGREQKIQYLLIPERHKDGAWHMHGLFSGLEIGRDLIEFTLADRLPHRLRNCLKNGQKVYNWGKIAQKFGFFTATEIKSHSAVSRYITKYVTKEVAAQGLKEGRHLFFASQGLKGRETVIKNGVGIDGELVRCPFSDNEFDFENEYVKIKWIDPSKEGE